MSAKHTPGPWELRGLGAYIPGTQRRIAESVVAWKSSDEADANARLIAAAPDLLEALYGVLRVADRKTVEFDAARIAIAKAIGEK